MDVSIGLSRDDINDLIESYLKTYSDNPSIMISNYNQEIQTTADYNGRQILELMQNADDAESDVIRIELDSKNCILTVSNNGNPFERTGVESLMYVGLTTKNKTEYIGNKGLGFRSILNWVDSVTILTQNVSFEFSRAISEKFYNDHLSMYNVVRERVERERREKRINYNTIPIAALAFPKIVEKVSIEYTTQIQLKYKKDEETNIQTQLKQISEETVLFLKNITQIVVVEDGCETRNILKEEKDDNRIVVGEKTWNIRDRLGIEYSADVKCDIIIAWQDDLSDKGTFYNFFPTDVPIGLPCLIHSTFDLTNNRKEINNSAENEFILKEIIELLVEIANELLIKRPVSWDAYLFLTPNSDNSRKFFIDFYDDIKEERKKIACYPTVNDSYVTESETKYHGSEFSKWIIKNEYTEFFENLSLPSDNLIIELRTKYYYFDEFYEIIDCINEVEGISCTPSIRKRAELINLLVRNTDGCFPINNDERRKLPLLLNNKNKFVPSTIRVFTKDMSGTHYALPSYVDDIDFISEPLYNKLKELLRDKIEYVKIDEKEGYSRPLKRLLNPIVNIGSDDIVDIITHIVNETNKSLKDVEQDSDEIKKNYIREMVDSLFNIFISNPERSGNLNAIEKIPIIARDGSIKYSRELFFGKEYKVGKKSELIFEGILNDGDYLIGKDYWNLIDYSEDYVIKFFRWLNVAEMPRHKKEIVELRHNISDKYVKYVFSEKEIEKSHVNKYYSVTKIEDISKIINNKNFTVEKLIAWLSLDDKFLRQIGEQHTDIFYTSYYNHETHYSNFTSYLKFIIVSSGLIKDVVFGNQLKEIGGLKVVDLQDPLFQKLGLKEGQITNVIEILGIKKSFNELSPELIFSLLKNYGKSVKAGSQQFYKTIYEYFRANEESQLKDIDYCEYLTEMHYICRNGGAGNDFESKPIEEVYYSDNKILPQKILNNYWFINLPKRTGEDNVKKFFGVKLIKGIVSNLQVTKKETHDFNNEFNKYIKNLKLYFLAYRLENIKGEVEKKSEANSIKAMEVELVNNMIVTSGEENIEIGDNEFIPKDNKFLIKQSEVYSLSELKNNSLFCDTIAEIICITFRVNDLKNTFRRIFRDGVKESKHILEIDDKVFFLEEAKKLLGISVEEQKFWMKIIPGFEDYQFENENYKEVIKKELRELPGFYNQIDFSNLGNKEGVRFLKWILSIKDENIQLDKLIESDTLNEWHSENLNDAMRYKRNDFRKLLWMKLNKSEIEDKKKFHQTFLNYENLVNNNEVSEVIDKWKYKLEPNYKREINNLSLEIFGVDLDEEIDYKIKVENKYVDILNEYQFGIDIEDMEKTISNYSSSDYSLLFFEGYENEIIEIAKRHSSITTDYDDKNDIEDLELIEADISSFNTKGYNGAFSNEKGSGSSTSRSRNRKTKIGKGSEEKVIHLLQSNNYTVEHVSVRSDSYHYDVEYKKEEDSEWRFLEIKTDSGNYFYMSEQEIKTATKEAHRYDLAIVSGNKVYLVKSPFAFEDNESFEKNSKFKAIPSEYIISLKTTEKSPQETEELIFEEDMK
ncbi:MAG: DUF3883 domain-containing protein [Fermentimonas sp.]|nr:DUF3883 domain-containing protein [Fermentimonas sp.]